GCSPSVILSAAPLSSSGPFATVAMPQLPSISIWQARRRLNNRYWRPDKRGDDMTKKIETQSTDLSHGEAFVKSWTENAAHLAMNGMYDPAEEKDNCGVGLVAAIDGKPSRAVVVAGIDALKAVWHRGAVDADGKTGDGCGIHVQIPQNFFKEHIMRTGHNPIDGRLAVGMVFLPKTNFEAQETCRTIVESEILAFGYYIYGWRQVPVDATIIGEKANATRPEIEQID